LNDTPPSPRQGSVELVSVAELVSVIVPSCNSARLVTTAVTSAPAQTCGRVEVIVVRALAAAAQPAGCADIVRAFQAPGDHRAALVGLYRADQSSFARTPSTFAG
jgi:hypothetical protein